MSSKQPSPSPSRNHTTSTSQTNGFNVPINTFQNTSTAGGWTEPPLRQAAPSFQDHGVGRAGVVENMMPLGTPPTARVRARAKGDPLRKVVQARHLGASGMVIDEGRGIPEVSVAGNTRAGSTRGDEESEGSASNIDPQLMEGVEFPEFPEPSYRPQTPGPSQTPPPSVTTAEEESRISLLSPTRQQQQQQPQIAQMHPLRTTPQLPVPHATPSLPYPSPSMQMPQSAASQLSSSTPSVSMSYTPSTVPSGSPFFTANSIAKRNGRPEVQQPLAYLYSALQQDAELERLLQEAVLDRSSDDPINDRHSDLGRKIKRVKKNYRAQSTSLYRSPFATGPQGANVSRQASLGSPAPLNSQNQTTIGTSSSATSCHQNSKITASSLPPRLSSAEMTAGALQTASGDDAPTGQPLLSSRRASSSSLSSTSSRKIEALDPSAAQTSPLKRSADEAGSLLDASDEAMEAQRKRLKRDFSGVGISSSNVRDKMSSGSTSPFMSRAASPPKPETKLKYWPPGVRTEVLEANDLATGVGPTTPTALGRPPSTKKKVTPRTKMSPIKKERKVAVAGLARPEFRSRGSSGEEAAKVEESDDNDSCAACGGAGFLLCCDGCDRSFHFSCLDPPIDQDGVNESQWFCSRCEAERNTSKRGPQGLFADLGYNIGKNNPRSFTLPQYIRDYFKDVETADSGEYSTAVEQRPIKGGRIGYDNENIPDYKKLRDAKGNAILCYACGKSALGGRDIIPCDYCNLNWHLDCLNPPRTNPPYRGNFTNLEIKTRPAWMCPAHVDHETKTLVPVHGGLARPIHAPHRAKTHRMRRPLNAVTVPVHMRRGFANNGMIEVESETSDSGFESDELPDGTVFKLPRQGIKLDFLDKVKQNRLAQERENREKGAIVQSRAETLRLDNERKLAHDISQRHIKERKIVFNLVQFHQANRDINIGDDELVNLLYTAEAETSPEVLAAMFADPALVSSEPVYDYGTRSKRKKQASAAVSQGLPSPSPSRAVSETKASSNRQREILLRMQAHIQKMLDVNEASTSNSNVNGVNGAS